MNCPPGRNFACTTPTRRRSAPSGGCTAGRGPAAASAAFTGSSASWPTAPMPSAGSGRHVPELVFGHASKDSLADVWKDNPVLREIREGLPRRLGGICGECLMKGICLGQLHRPELLQRPGSLGAPLVLRGGEGAGPVPREASCLSSGKKRRYGTMCPARSLRGVKRNLDVDRVAGQGSRWPAGIQSVRKGQGAA